MTRFGKGRTFSPACLTTLAMTEGGREAPKRVKTKIDTPTRNRWLEGRRQYAPWFYGERDMLTHGSGCFYSVLVETKAALRHFDRGFTSSCRVTEKDRHRLLGNSWHMDAVQQTLDFICCSMVSSPCRALLARAAREPRPCKT